MIRISRSTSPRPTSCSTMPATPWGPTACASTRSPARPLEFRFYSRRPTRHSIDIGPYVRDWLEQIGIKLDAQTITATSWQLTWPATTTCSTGAGTRTPTRTTSSTSSRAPSARRTPTPTATPTATTATPHTTSCTTNRLVDRPRERHRRRPPDAVDPLRDQPYLVMWNAALLRGVQLELDGSSRNRPERRSARGVRSTVLHQYPAGRGDDGRRRRLLERYLCRRVDLILVRSCSSWARSSWRRRGVRRRGSSVADSSRKGARG